MIEAQHITKTYRSHRVLDDANLAVAPGRCVVIGGDNGSGKTTLLHVMMGLRRPDSGEVLWHGRSLTRSRDRAWLEARKQWGFLPQHPVFPGGATVDSIVRFHVRLRRGSRERAASWLDRVGLAGDRNKRVEMLSGGMRQRLGIALVMFFDPDLVVMDEPTSSLDPGWRSELVGWLEAHADRGAAVLVTSQLREPWGTDVDDLWCEQGRIGPPPVTQQSGEAAR